MVFRVFIILIVPFMGLSLIAKAAAWKRHSGCAKTGSLGRIAATATDDLKQ